MIRALLITLITIAISGCGGGGSSGSSSTSTSLDFQLFPAGYFSSGYKVSINLTGTGTAGGTYTATISQQTQSQTTFLSQPAIPLLSQLQFTNTSTSATINDIATDYYSTSITNLQYLGYTNSSSQTASSTPTTIPQTAKIGDFGVIGTYTDNAGSVDTESWRLDDGGNGHAKLVLFDSNSDQSGTLQFTETDTYLIDTSGNRISMQAILYYPNQTTITLNGTF